MFGIGTGELLVILVIAMLVVGPERIVTFSRKFGEFLAKVRAQTDSVTKDLKEAMAAETADLQDANPLAAITELKREAEATVRDLQGSLSLTTDIPNPLAAVDDLQKEAASAVREARETLAGRAPAAKPPYAAAAGTPSAPAAAQATTSEPATPEPEVPEATGPEDLGGVELIDDECADLGGPELVEDAATPESEAHQ